MYKMATTDFVSSDQFRRTVTSLEDEIKKLKAVQESQDSALTQFAGEVSVTGLSDSIKAKHPIVKCLWIMIFAGGIACATFFVYKSVEEYNEEPTATKIRYILNDTYDLPRVVLCFDTWLNVDKATRLGLSKEGLEYALRYLIPFEEVAEQQLRKSKNFSGAQEEFQKIFNENNFTNLPDFIKYVALDAVANSKKEDEIGFTCGGCVHNGQLNKVIIDKAVCYEMILEAIDGRFRQAYGLPDFKFRVPDLSQGLVEKKTYWKLYVDPMRTHLLSDMPYQSINEFSSHSVRITIAVYDCIPTDKNPCVPPDSDPLSTGMGCILKCASQFYRHVHGCNVFNLDWNHSRPLTEYCNTYGWDRWPLRDVDVNRSRYFMNKCVDKCQSLCVFNWYQTQIDSHRSASLAREAAEWKNRTGGEVEMRYAKLFFISVDALAGGMESFVEVSTYSFQSFVGTIGGTCGIWIGASVMTLIQFCMFFIERKLEKPYKGDRRKSVAAKEKVTDKKDQSDHIVLVQQA